MPGRLSIVIVSKLGTFVGAVGKMRELLETIWESRGRLGSSGDDVGT